MKAAVYRAYGPPDVVRLEDAPKPVPGDREVLVKVLATTVSTADWRARSLEMPPGFGPIGRLIFGVFGPRKPILGTELSGVVEAVGSRVTRFKPGDEVFAFPGAGFGCHAEFRSVAEDGPVMAKPANLSHEEAAALSFGGATALHFLRDRCGLKAGEKVLVIGASGCVGSAAVQIARHFGAEVTGVSSARNLDLVRSIGADNVIDYAETDFTATGARYDVIFDTTGSASYARCESALAEGGRLVLILANLWQMLSAIRSRRIGGRKIIAGPAPERREDLETLAAMAEAGAYKPVIDSVYPLAKAAEAHARVDTGRKRGSVVLKVEPASDV